MGPEKSEALECFLFWRLQRQSFTEWPSLKILDLWRQLQTSCEHEFSCFSPYLSSRIFKENEPLNF